MKRTLAFWLLLMGAAGAQAVGPLPAGWKIVDAAEGSVAPPPGPNRLLDSFRREKIRLYAIRHGESEANARALRQGARILSGQSDTPLSPLGRREAETAAEKIVDLLGKDRRPLIFSSPLCRARETANATIARLAEANPAATPILDPRLLEYDFGDYESFSVPDACRALPTFMHFWDPSEGLGIDFLHRFPHGESRCDVLIRVDSFLRELVARPGARGRTVLLFCHMRTIAAAQEDLGKMALGNGRMREVTAGLKNATPICLTD